MACGLAGLLPFAAIAAALSLEWSPTYPVDVPWEVELSPAKLSALAGVQEGSGFAVTAKTAAGAKNLRVVALEGRVPGTVALRFNVPPGTAALSCAAGVGKLFGITGGFLLSFPIMSWLAGKGEEKKSMPWLIASLVLGAVLNYIIGMCWFVFVAESSFAAAFTACVLPFIPTAIIKVLMAAFLGKELRSALVKAQVLTAA